MKLNGVPWQKLFLEIVTILIGIMLALAIDEWQKENEKNQKANLIKEKILKEIRSNYQEIKGFNDIVKNRYKKLLEIESEVDGSQGFHTYTSRFVGYRFTELNDSAWKRANTGILANYIDDTFIEKAFHLYNWNNTLQTFHLKMNDFLYQPHSFDPDKAKYAWYISKRYKSQQISWSNIMLDEYAAFLEAYEPKQNKSVTADK